jgi:hypothetical protein
MLCWASMAQETASRAWPKGHKEGVALGVDLMPVPFLKGPPQQLALFFQDSCILPAQLLQQAGGAFDIGEQEGDRAFGQVAEGDGGRG